MYSLRELCVVDIICEKTRTYGFSTRGTCSVSSTVKVAIGQRITDTSHQGNTYIAGMLI